MVRYEADASLHGARDIIEGDNGGCKAQPMAVEEIFLKLVQVWTIRERHQKRQRGGSTTRWRKCLMFIARDVKNGFRAARHVGAMEEGRRWCPVLETIFANLWLEDYGVGGHTTLLPTHRHQRQVPPRCLRDSRGLGAGPPRGATGVRRRNGQN